MKKILSILLVIGFLLMFSGCEKKTEEVIEDNELVGGWKTVLKGNSANMISKAYETFLELNSKKYELVGLLGRRHTTNDEYMFLVKDTKNYRVIVVEEENGNVKITKNTVFDYTKYTHNDIAYKETEEKENWYTEMPSDTGVTFEENIQTAFDNAASKKIELPLKPIALLGTQVVAGTNYAIICYGYNNTEIDYSGIYLITLYVDLDNNSQIINTAYVDLNELTK